MPQIFHGYNNIKDMIYTKYLSERMVPSISSKRKYIEIDGEQRLFYTFTKGEMKEKNRLMASSTIQASIEYKDVNKIEKLITFSDLAEFEQLDKFTELADSQIFYNLCEINFPEFEY